MSAILNIINRYKKTIILIASFFVPVFLLLLVYKYANIYPFGKFSLLIMDLDAQYIDFMIYLKHAITDGSSLIYSWTKAGGAPLLDLFFYYTASPLNLILLFFEDDKMYNAVLLLNLLKIGMCGVSFSIFLYYKNRNWSLNYVFLACLYSLCTYNVAYSMCLMWLDALILLPIILIGVEKILKENKCILFICSYTLMFFSNFYTCYMITIFVAIYFIYMCIITDEKQFIKKGLLLCFAGIVSVLILSWQLLPSIENMAAGKLLKGVTDSKSFFTVSADTFIKMIFPAQCNKITNQGGPSVFSSVIVTIFISLYMVNPKIKVKEKISSGAVIFFLLLSFYINAIDVFWHMFQAPTWFPCRYAFVFVFFVLFISSKSLLFMKHMSIKRIILTSACVLFFYVLIFVLAKDKIPNTQGIIVSFILIILYGVLLTLEKAKKRRVFFVLIAIIMTFEIVYNSLYTVERLHKVFKYKQTSEFEEFISSVSEYIDKIQKYDDGFYRIEKDFSRSNNDSMTLGYNGIAHYSSSYSQSYNNILRSLGILQTNISLEYKGATPVTSSLLGVKYFFAKKPKLYEGYKEMVSEKNFTVLQNEYFLPIGYAVNEDILEIGKFSKDYISNQNLLTEAICGIECFEKMTFEQNSNVLEITATNNSPLYISIDDYKNTIDNIKVNGEVLPKSSYGKSRLCSLGSFSEGDKITVSFKNKLSDKVYLYSFNMKEFKKMHEKLNSNILNITSHSDTKLEGNFTADSDKLFFTSINYDKNWTIKIDGKEVTPVKLLNNYIGVFVPSGQHEITFTYTQTSFYIGIGISLTTVMFMVLVLVLRKQKKAKNYISSSNTLAD
ncbi:MAG: hypothetical protein E7404_08635 [Ruminococcaceae bacterium]|nr:hypothetical protein [Oscillospiraceae bacterium]